MKAMIDDDEKYEYKQKVTVLSLVQQTFVEKTSVDNVN